MTNRRELLQVAATAALTASFPQRALAQAAPARAATLRCVMHADLASLDPIATTAVITSYHGGLIYDTLFGHDAEGVARPQMVSDYAVSEDGLRYGFSLRPGLRFHDGQPVTARDCVASVKRWGARDGAGQHLFRRIADIAVKDDVSFSITLREPYPLLLDWLGKSSPSICFIMREADAATDPARPLTTAIGSGPFVFNRGETRTGSQYVYDRNRDYVARSEPASGFAGGKLARMERIILQTMPDEQTAVSALQAGEIDLIEKAPIELLSQFDGDRNIKLEVLNKTGSMGWLRMNFLHPPFNNVKARQAMLHLVDQAAIMKATFGDPKYYRVCGSLFSCGTTMENDVNTDWLKRGPDIAEAAALFKEAGYDGKPVVIMQLTTTPVMNNAALLVAQWLRGAGVNVDLVPLDWAGIVARRANKAAPAAGGWNILMTYASGNAYDNPITLAGHAANGQTGWFGWPEDTRHEQLRDAWVAAKDQATRKSIAREMQDNAWNFVPHIYLGQWIDTAAMRSNVDGLIGLPDLVPFWNVRRA